MKDIKKYQGVIPAFYACYDAEGNISTEGVKALTRHLIAKGVKGVYVGGSSGECIYQNTSSLRTATITCCRAAPQTWWLLCSAAMPTLCWLPTG